MWTLASSPPEINTNVLATIEDTLTHTRFVFPCVYNWDADMETGEIIGGKSYFSYYVVDGVMNGTDWDKGTTKVIAWMKSPEPYNEFRVIVAGSRKFSDYELMKKTLDNAFSKHQPTCILCGLAQGADLLGKRYAEERHIPVEEYPADWANKGRGAGYIRNEQMAANADALIAFWNGTSNGTRHMINTAQNMGLQVRVIKY